MYTKSAMTYQLFSSFIHRIRTNRRWRMCVVTLWHLVGISLAYWGAFLLRFDFEVPENYFALFWRTLPAALFIYYVAFTTFRTDQSTWSYFGLDDLMRKGVALVAGTIGMIAAIYLDPELLLCRLSAFRHRHSRLAAWLVGSRWPVCRTLCSNEERTRGCEGESHGNVPARRIRCRSESCVANGP